MIRDANQKFDSNSFMKGSYCEGNIYIDETLILCSEKDILWLCIVITQLKICWNVWKKCTFDDLLW